MFNFIKKSFLKKKKFEPQIETREIDNFLSNRPNDWISLYDYSSNRFNNNQFFNLNIEIGLVVPINASNNEEFQNHINENYILLKEAMELKGRNFVNNIYDIGLLKNLDLSYLNYYFPILNNYPISSKLEYLKVSDKDILDFIGFRGNLTAGFLSFTNSGVIFLGIKTNESLEEFTNLYINNLPTLHSERLVLYSIRNDDQENEPYVDIDDETKSIINQIEENLLKLKQSGQFFLFAPKLEQMIKNLSKLEAIDVTLSHIVIDKEFRIILPQYQNKEIILSHLTKATYILFLKHPEGILLSELSKYEAELFSIYKSVSYQVSLDKMKATVHELVNDDKAIFVHFSRIKSAFTKQFTDYYANFYYIQGKRGEKKYIKLLTEKISFE